LARIVSLIFHSWFDRALLSKDEGLTTNGKSGAKLPKTVHPELVEGRTVFG
jgi:hypothetical protein